MATILLNCVFLAMTETVEEAEYVLINWLMAYLFRLGEDSIPSESYFHSIIIQSWVHFTKSIVSSDLNPTDLYAIQE